MLLRLTTHIRRGLLIGAAFLVWAPAAHAWSWPVAGPVLQPFVYDPAQPYAAGQHRGIDVGADSSGETVVAPAAGTVSFAGSVPTNGESVTIQTADGYSVTLTHLGSILVDKGATVAEREAVGTIGPSGTPEFDRPYVHLGIRTTADPNGYLDPLRFLPPVADPASTGPGSATSQPTTSAGSSSSPAPAASTRPAVHKSRTQVSPDGRERTAPSSASRPVRTQQSLQRPASRPQGGNRAQHHVRHKRHRPHGTNSARRPVVETAVPDALTRLGVGHEIRSSPHLALPQPQQAAAPAPLLPVALNGLATLVAVAAALVAGRRRHDNPPVAQVLHLPRRALARRAA